MYINPFVFGVLATVGAEILALVVYCCYCFFEAKQIDKRKNMRKEMCDNEKNVQNEESKKEHE